MPSVSAAHKQKMFNFTTKVSTEDICQTFLYIFILREL